MPHTSKSIWDKEIPVPVQLIQYVDEAVVEKLPAGTQIKGILPSGSSYWARTAKIEALDAEGNESNFFMKVHQRDIAKQMCSSEHDAMKLLHSVMPEITAEPLGWGSYKDSPDAWFFVSRFSEMSDDIPDVADFPALLAEMHRRGVSSTGEFGYADTTYGGRNPVYFGVHKTWEECFSTGLKNSFILEEETHGQDDELTRLQEGIMNLVIPRLLRPLETEGRTLTPRLCHGDMWDGNASVDVNTGRPMIFDPTPLYAHHEYEMAPWWPPRHKMTSAYIAEYNKHFPVSEPAEDWKDRGLLYSLRFDVHASSLYTGNLRFRLIAMENMKILVDKYPGGYEGYATAGAEGKT